MEALRHLRDSHTIVGIWIRMVFCKIKLGDVCQFANTVGLACYPMQHSLVLLYSHINLFRLKQPTHRMFFGLNSYVDSFCLVFKHP